jgi:hypothetical protein
MKKLCRPFLRPQADGTIDIFNWSDPNNEPACVGKFSIEKMANELIESDAPSEVLLAVARQFEVMAWRMRQTVRTEYQQLRGDPPNIPAEIKETIAKMAELAGKLELLVE